MGSASEPWTGGSMEWPLNPKVCGPWVAVSGAPARGSLGQCLSSAGVRQLCGGLLGVRREKC